jgi:hypothetical protein
MLGAIVVTTIVHAYLHRKLVRDTALDGRARRAARIALVALAALFPAGMGTLLAMRVAPRAVQAPIMWCAFTWVGVLLFFLPLLLASETARAIPLNVSRRRVIARVFGAVSGVASIALGGIAMVVAHAPVRVRRLRVALPYLGASMNGYKIVQLSDVHVSATLGGALVLELVEKINALGADLVVVTGDLVDGSVAELGALVAPFARLRARDGVYFVTGNHEYLSGADEWVAFVSSSLGFRVLRNERVAIGGAAGFDLVGVDDSSGTSDLDGALRDRDAARASILLAHRPDDVDRAVRAGIGLQLSGHTHGGQIAPTWWALERIRQPYVYGAYALGETFLYVTSGAGYWGPPMRLGTRAEIALFELSARA